MTTSNRKKKERPMNTFTSCGYTLYKEGVYRETWNNRTNEFDIRDGSKVFIVRNSCDQIFAFEDLNSAKKFFNDSVREVVNRKFKKDLLSRITSAVVAERQKYEEAKDYEMYPEFSDSYLEDASREAINKILKSFGVTEDEYEAALITRLSPKCAHELALQ